MASSTSATADQLPPAVVISDHTIPSESTENLNSSISTDTQKAPQATNERPLPPLSPSDFKIYNQLAETMETFHTHFKQTWPLFHTACTSHHLPPTMSRADFLATGIQFCQQLTLHHTIEETHIFPSLAVKMPDFQTPAQRTAAGIEGAHEGGAAELIRQHEVIHEGMAALETYLSRALGGEGELEWAVMQGLMDSWGEVLWRHLDEEVRALGAENMRRFWSLEEMGRMPTP